MKDFLNSPVVVTIVSSVGAIIVAYIANIWAKHRREARHPDRMSTIFDGYEKLIAQQQDEISRKSVTISALEEATNRLEQQLNETRQLLDKAREELAESKQHNQELKSQLRNMRAEYKESKKEEV